MQCILKDLFRWDNVTGSDDYDLVLEYDIIADYAW